jgi:hypothetical protein
LDEFFGVGLQSIHKPHGEYFALLRSVGELEIVIIGRLNTGMGEGEILREWWIGLQTLGGFKHRYYVYFA